MMAMIPVAVPADRHEEDGTVLHIQLQGELAAVALYAALLDGRIRTLILESPPATQNAPVTITVRGAPIRCASMPARRLPSGWSF